EVGATLASFGALGTKQLLEVGCDAAQFLDFMQERFGCKTYFDEPSERARRVIVEKKRHVAVEDAPGVRFDVIVARHVLEHVGAPVQWLADLAARLDDGGLLFV